MQGKVINNISNLYYVESNNEIYKCSGRGKLKKDGLVVGDNVIFNNDIIEKVCTRKNYLKRPKIANITQIICVIAAKHPKPDLLMLDKQLAFAEYLGINTTIVINKTDLDEKKADNIYNIYKKIGYKVIKTNAKSNIGVEELNVDLKNNISVFSGNSGVGKSTLLNDIFGKELTKSGVISNKNKRGKNTTTNVKLYKIQNNEYIADTPGFSTFDISEIQSNELKIYFKEFLKFVNRCRYVGCNHIKEDECGIKEALKENEINLKRYENYINIYNELKDKEEHKW